MLLADQRLTLVFSVAAALLLGFRFDWMSLGAEGGPAPSSGEPARALEPLELPPTSLRWILRQELPHPEPLDQLMDAERLRRLYVYVAAGSGDPELDAGWPRGGLRLPAAPEEARDQDLFLGLELLSPAVPASLELVTAGEERLPLGLVGGDSPGVLLLRIPASTRARSGDPVQLAARPGAPPPGRLRGLWWGWIPASPPTGEDLDILLGLLERHVVRAVRTGGVLGRQEQVWVRRLAEAAKERLEARPTPRRDPGRLARLHRCLRLVFMLQELGDVLPRALVRYTGALAVRPVLGIVRARLDTYPLVLGEDQGKGLQRAFCRYQGLALCDKGTMSARLRLLSATTNLRLAKLVVYQGVAWTEFLAPAVQALVEMVPDVDLPSEEIAAEARRLVVYLTRLGVPTGREATGSARPLFETLEGGPEALRRLVEMLEHLPPSPGQVRELRLAHALAGA